MFEEAQGSSEEVLRDGALGGQGFLPLVPQVPTPQTHAVAGDVCVDLRDSGSGRSLIQDPRSAWGRGGGGWVEEDPAPQSWRHPAHLLLPPTPAWPVGLHKAFFMPGVG